MIKYFTWKCMKGVVILAMLMSFLGCSKSDSVTAPAGASISINPATTSFTGISGDTTQNFTITVLGEDGLPLNRAQVFISGSFAAPRSPARYQFYRQVNGVGAVDSGFTAETDEFGTYNFSIIIPATVNGSANAFTDNINVYSGAAFVSASVSLS